jgi:PAS domain S-box-containing protein
MMINAANESWTSMDRSYDLPDTQEADRINSILNIFKGVEEYVLDLNGTIVSSNLEAVTITGYEEWEVIGRHFSIFYSIEDQIKRVYEEDLEKANQHGSCFSSGMRVKKRNSPFWAKLKFEAHRENDGSVSCYRLTIQDATHKAIYSHNLSLVKDEYLNLFNNPFIGIFKFRISDFKLLMVNEKAESIFGKNWSSLYLDTFFIDSMSFQNLINKLNQDRKIENYEFEIINRLGGRSWVSLSGKLFNTVGFVEGVIMDITDRRREIEKTLSLSNELESFIYHASHDLRSPVTSIYGLVNLLRREHSEEQVFRYAQLIEGRLFHLDNMLRDIVEIAFNTAVPVFPEAINFSNELKHLLSVQAKGYTKVATEITVNQEIDFRSDLTRVRSIMRNLLSNAFKYHNPVHERPSIKITVDVGLEDTVITVQDNGIGIRPEHNEKVFSLFYRATESHKGNGLGLYIVKAMVNLLGGEIDFVSTMGVGTKFIVKLPNIPVQEFKKSRS